MKYLIFAVALLVATNADGNCLIYNCDAIPAATPTPCIAPSATAVSINTCPAGNACPYGLAGFPNNPTLTA